MTPSTPDPAPGGADVAPSSSKAPLSGSLTGAVALAARTVVGSLFLLSLLLMVVLWPAGGGSGQRLDAAQSARVVEVVSAATLSSPETLRVELLSDGPVGSSGVLLDVEFWPAPSLTVAAGDRVKVAKLEVPRQGAGGTFELSEQVQVVDFDRSLPLVLLAALFVVAILAVGGVRGAMSLAGLSVTLAVVLLFLVPAILAGSPPLLVALAAGCFVTVTTMYSSHGLAPHVTAAAAGTLLALIFTCMLAAWAISATRLSGLADEHAYAAFVSAGGLDLRGLVLAGLLIAALGVLDDVTVSQSSTVWALSLADPSQSRRSLFAAAMRVGRDHIAAVVNTLFLAYTGASLTLLLLFHTGGLPAGEIVSSEVVAQEVVRTLVGSVGLALAVPISTLLAVMMVHAGGRRV